MHKKIMSIELLRIIACFLVIIAHIQLNFVDNGIVLDGRLFFSTIVSDNVPIFFLIMGFFLFKDTESDDNIIKKYIVKIKNTFINIWIPSLIVVIFSTFAYFWITGKVTNINFNIIYSFILKFKAIDITGHLWYVCSYVLIIMFFPLLAILCQDKKERNYVRRIIITICFIYVIISNIFYILNIESSYIKDLEFINYFLYVFVGYEISVFLKKNSSNDNISYISLLLYLSFLVIKFFAQKAMFNYYGITIKECFVWLSSFFTYCTSSCLFIYVYSSLISKKENKIINFLGENTFYTYLVHVIVVNKTSNLKPFFLNINNGCENYLSTLLYYIEYGFIIYFISLIVGIAFKKVYFLLTSRHK